MSYLSKNLSLQIVKLVDDDNVLNDSEVNNYLTSNFLPFVLSMYAGTAKVHTSFEDFFALLVQAIVKLELKKESVSKHVSCNS